MSVKDTITLMENEAFKGAIETLRERLTNNEDDMLNRLTMSDEELFTAMKRIAGLRLLLNDLVDELNQEYWGAKTKLEEINQPTESN